MKERCEHQIRKIRLLCVGVPNAVEELRPDDAPTAPDGCQRAKVEVPVIFGRPGPEVLKPLRVSNDLRRVKSFLKMMLWPTFGESFVVLMRFLLTTSTISAT